MARKTFISYKYSEAKDLRDRIVESLGEDAKYYQGETSDSCQYRLKIPQKYRNKIPHFSVLTV